MNEAPLGLLFSFLGILLLLSGFFSGSETGMMAINRYRLRHLKKAGHRGAVQTSKLLEKPENLISLILIGNNFVNILAASIATVIAIRLYGDNAILLGSLLLTLVVLIFSEIIPKTIAAYRAERVAFAVSYVLLPLQKLMFPLVWMVNRITHFIMSVTGVNPSGDNEPLSIDELRTIVGEAGHMIPKRHQGMLLNILDLEEITVDDIMIPRSEVYGIDIDDDLPHVLRKLRESEFTRMPVYDKDINNIIGVLHQRDVVGSIDTVGQVDRELLLKALREPYFIPEGTPLHTQLFNFQRNKHRLGIVVDEYGMIQGIVTLEDLLEEIVGEFTSNLIEESNQDIIPQADDSFIIDGTTTIRDINKTLHWQLPTDGPKTLNGLLLEHLESFPDGLATVKLGHYLFEIVGMKDNLIQQVRGINLGKKKKKKVDDDG